MIRHFQCSQPLHLKYQAVEMNAFAPFSTNSNAVVLFGLRRSIDRVEHQCPTLEEEDYFDLCRSERFMGMVSSVYKPLSLSSPFPSVARTAAIATPPSDADFETPTTTSSRKRMNNSDDYWGGSPTCRQRVIVPSDDIPVDISIVTTGRSSQLCRTIVKASSFRTYKPTVMKKKISHDFDSCYNDDLLKAPVLALERWNNEFGSSSNDNCNSTTNHQQMDSPGELDFKIDLRSQSPSHNKSDPKYPTFFNLTNTTGTSDDFGEFLEFNLNLPFVHDRVESIFSQDIDDQKPFDLKVDQKHNLDPSPYSHGDNNIYPLIESTRSGKGVPCSPRRVRVSDGRVCKVHSPAKEYRNYKNGNKLPVYRCSGCQSGIACSPGQIENVFCTICEVFTRANEDHFSGYYLHDGKLVRDC